MSKYILKRLLALIPVIVGITLLIFFVMSLSPGDPAAMQLGSAATTESIAQLRAELGLDRPMIIQYLRYMANLFRGNMGNSYITGNPVFTEIATRFPYTLKLSFLSMVLAIAVSIPIGIICATRPNSMLDAVSMIFALVGLSMPAFWCGLMLILIFSVWLGWFPAVAANSLKGLTLPSITLALGSMAIITRITRSSMLEVIRQDYIRTAKAKGVSRKNIIRKHALPNAMIPTITVIGLEIGTALSGAVLTETVFAWPGLGRLVVDSIKNKDTPLVLGSIMVFAVSFSLVNLIVDILYAYLDPRIRSQYK